MKKYINCFPMQLRSLFLFVLIALTIPAISFAVEYGGIGGRPANPDPENPRTESIFVHTVNPSETVEDGIRLLNNTAETKTLMVYAVDSVVSTDGAFACDQLDNPQSGVGTWITLEKAEVELESMTNEVVPFAINVPETASVGEQNGCIVVQEKSQPQSASGGIGLTFRTGLRVALLVPGEVTRELKMAGFVVDQKDNGHRILRPSIENLGNVSVDTDILVTTRYFFGKTLAKHGGQYPVLRGETSTWNFDLEKPFWGGWYKSTFEANYDANPEAGVGTKSGKELTNLKGGSVTFYSAPTAAALAIEIVVLLFIIFVIILLCLHYKRKNWMKNKWVDYDVVVEDDIKSLGDKFDVSWKLVAKANNLKPPFTLNAGDKIKVPPKK